MRGDWVVDASVGVKPYLDEDLSEVAESLFQKARAGRASLYIPDLFYNECANIFWKHVRRLEIQADYARRSLRNLVSVDLLPIASTHLVHDALDLALDFGISAYDASYVALAQKLGLPLVTADQKLIAKIRRQPHRPRLAGRSPRLKSC